VSILLEAMGRGLDCDLREILRPFYWQGHQDNTELSQGDTCDYGGPTPSESSFLAGLEHWREGRCDQARELFSRSCGHDHHNVAARAALAAVLGEQGLTANALEQLRVLDRSDAEQPAVQLAMGYCYEKLANPTAATVHFRRASSLDETLVSARFRLGAIAIQADKMDEAIDQYTHICHAIPEDTWLRSTLANLQFRAGQYDQAVETFQTVLAMEPENWALEDERVTALVAAGNLREAIKLTRDSIEEQGPFADLHVRIANLYSMAGDDDLAVKNFHEALDIQPGYVEALAKLAVHHTAFGRWEEAAEAFGLAGAQQEKLLANYLGLGVAQASAGRASQAAGSFDQAVACEPDCTRLHVQMIKLHWKITVADEFLQRVETGEHTSGPVLPEDRLQSELQCHAEWVDRQGDRADARFHYGVLLRSLGRFEEATRQFAQAVRYHKTHLPSQLKLGVVLHEQGKDKAAANVFLRIMQPGQAQIDFHYRLGVAYTQADLLEKLTEEMQANQPEFPHKPEVQQTLAMSLETLGLLDRGAKTWRALNQAHQVAR